MLSKLAKIANRLDSIGLTKEADVLDAFIRKVASDSSREYKRFESTLGSLSKSGLVSYIYNNKLSQTKDNIIAAGYYLGLSSDSSNFNNVGYYDTKAVNVILSNMTNAINALSGGKSTYNTASEFFTAFAIPEDAFKSAVQAGITDAENIIASRDAAQRPAAAPAPAAATVSVPATGWEAYLSKAGPMGTEVKKAWVDYSASGVPGVNQSFSSFTSWYNRNLKGPWGGKHKTPSEVIKLIKSEKSWEVSMADPWGSGSGPAQADRSPSMDAGAFTGVKLSDDERERATVELNRAKGYGPYSNK